MRWMLSCGPAGWFCRGAMAVLAFQWPGLPALLAQPPSLAGLAAQPPVDIARLREMLLDRGQPRLQNQAALALIQVHSGEAEALIRQGLEQAEDNEMFLALASAIRFNRDLRFTDELVKALSSNKTAIRQGASQALSVLAEPRVIEKLSKLLEDPATETSIAQAVAFTLGASGRKQSVPPLIKALGNDSDKLRQAASDALGDLTGQKFGLDSDRWNQWWQTTRDLPVDRWLEDRLAFQLARRARLENELEGARSQVVRLQQELYARLGTAERLEYLPGMCEQEDPALRLLAVNWCQEALAGADPAAQKILGSLLLRLSGDAALEVQRAAALALGRVPDIQALDRLLALTRSSRPTVRAASSRALSQQAAINRPELKARQGEVLASLQRLLEDPVLEVVVEAAEDLGALGASESGPVLTALLRHPSESVRKAAAASLERVAQPKSLDAILKALDDSSGTVRFSLVGALAKLAVRIDTPASPAPEGQKTGDLLALTETDRVRLLARLEIVLMKDMDPNVRARAAGALGECGPPSLLPVLWQASQPSEDVRVQEKAWLAMIDTITRARQVSLVQEWDRKLAQAKVPARRLQFLTEVLSRWTRKADPTLQLGPIQDLVIQVALEQNKWSLALPLVRETMAKPQRTEMELQATLRYLLQAGEQALADGNPAEALRVAQEGKNLTTKESPLAPLFDGLANRSKSK
ncbi:MAG: HEAT repeat domain-containing protein [Gemmataceae bacterium]|nr:HEAT repeat domain-containing protein [Gemmataceae bacterium]